LFNGDVTAVEYGYDPSHGREIRIRGYDVLHRLRKTQSVRAHVQATLEDLVSELTSDLGVTVEADESGPFWHRLFQYERSDLEFLSETAQQCGLYMTLREDVLHLISLQGKGDSIPLTLGESLLEARFELNGEASCRSVTTTGWSPLSTQVHEGEAYDARSGRKVIASVEPVLLGGIGQRDLVGTVVQDDRHAEVFAQAELDSHIAREVVLWGIAEGDVRIRPGTPVDVSGVAELMTGQYVVTSATHTIDSEKGFLTEFSTLPPFPKERTKDIAIAPGVVTRVDDPDGLSRIRVSLPTYGDVETEWMQVLSAGAGSGKGLVVLPDVGDQVVVMFPRQNPELGMVLGGLFGMEGSPDSGVEGNSVQRYSLSTPGGQRIQLNDAGHAIRVEDSTGSYIEFSPDRVLLHSEVDLHIEAPGQSVVIRGNTIDFDRA
jgi:phage baseplate assembly protein V